MEEGLDMKNHFRIKILADPISIREPPSKIFFDTKFNDPGKLKNSAHVDCIHKKLNNVRFVKVNSIPAVGEHFLVKKISLITLFVIG